MYGHNEFDHIDKDKDRRDDTQLDRQLDKQIEVPRGKQEEVLSDLIVSVEIAYVMSPEGEVCFNTNFHCF